MLWVLHAAVLVVLCRAGVTQGWIEHSYRRCVPGQHQRHELAHMVDASGELSCLSQSECRLRPPASGISLRNSLTVATEAIMNLAPLYEEIRDRPRRKIESNSRFARQRDARACYNNKSSKNWSVKCGRSATARAKREVGFATLAVGGFTGAGGDVTACLCCG